MRQKRQDGTDASENDAPYPNPSYEQRLSELHSRLEDQEIIFDQSNILAARYYPATRTIVFPPRTAEVFGVDLVVKDFPESFVEQDGVVKNADQFVAFYEAIRRGEPSGRNSTEIRVASGELRLFNRTFTTVYDSEGQPYYGVISLIDITEKREQLLAAEKWSYISRSLKADNVHYYDYNMSQDILEAIDGNSPSVYPEQYERSFSGVARYVADNVIHPDDREEYLRIFDRKNLLERFARGETEIITEHRRRGPGGDIFHAQGVVQLYLDPFNGDVLSVVVIKNMEESLAQWKAKLNDEARQLLSDSVPGGIVFVYDKPGHPFYSINRGLLEYLGYDSREELEAATNGLAGNFVYPEDRDFVQQSVDEALKKGPQYRLNHRVLKKDGTVLWVAHRGHKSVTPDGQEILISLLADVTEVVKLQEELKSQAADLEIKNRDMQTLAENVPGGVSVMDMDGKFSVVYANQTFFEMHGYTREQARDELNFEMIRLIHPDDAASALQIVTKARDSGKMRFEHEMRVYKRDKSLSWVMIRGTIIETDGKPFIHAVTLDVTRRKRNEEKLKEHEKALRATAEAAEEATRMKSVFLANMSHEIRTPLNGVIGFAELALDDFALSEKTRTYLNKIKLSASGLLEIINDILDISKIEAGKMELDRTEFNLHDVFKQCETISSVKAEEKGVDLYFYSEPDLWKILIGDPTKLRQVLLNLLSNAIKFTNRGIVKLAATVEQLHEDDVWIHFEVRDSGIGMSKEQLDKVFEPFTQGDAGTTRRFGGTGLGLPITRSMIELMGGELNVESSVGIGSKFSFTLPFKTKDMPQETGETPNGESEEPEILSKPVFQGEALVCEDNPINQDVICDHLAKVGLRAVVAANGKIGLDMVKKRLVSHKPFDLIFMDIHMPVMDGLEAARHIIRLGVTTPIIALTANAMEKDRNAYLANGMSEYVAKPFRSQDLWACLLKFLEPVSMTPVSTEESVPASFNTPPGSVIDKRLGLERSAGDVNLYGRIWTGFLKRNWNVVGELQQCLDAGDAVQAHQIAHTLKGTAGLLGATALSEAARHVEAALAGNPPTQSGEPIQNRMKQLKTAMDAVMKELESDVDRIGKESRSILPQTSTDPSASSPGDHPANSPDRPVDQAAIVQLLDKLEPLLESGSSKSTALLEDVQTMLSSFGEDARLLIEQIEEYDFEIAGDTLSRIRRRLENEAN